MQLERLSGEERENLIKRHVEKIENNDLDSLLILANYYNYIENDYDNAIMYYQIGINKKSESCYLHLADYYKSNGNYEMAFEIWKKGIDEIKSERCYLNWANYYLSNDNHVMAIEIWKKGIDEIKSEKCYLDWANYYLSNDNHEMAIEIWKKGIDEIKSEDYYLEFADYYKSNDNPEMAFEIWKKGIDEIKSTICMIRLGNYYVMNESYDEAIKYYNMSYEHGNIFGLIQLGLFYQYKIGDYEKMKSLFIKAIKHDEYDGAYYLGEYYCRIKNYDVMKRYLKLAIKKENDRAMFILGYYYEIIENNIDLALNLYVKGAKYGNKNCIEAIRNYVNNFENQNSFLSGN